MRTAILLPLLVIALGLCLSGLPGVMADEDAAEMDAVDVEAVFKGNCASCHDVPDTALPMDLAWLDQVHRTT